MSTDKIGGKWCKVQLQIAPEKCHVGEIDRDTVIDTRLSRVDMSLNHRIKYACISGVDLVGLTYLRVLRFAHLYYQSVRIGADSEEGGIVNRMLDVLKASIKSHKWRDEHLPSLYRLQRMIDTQTKSFHMDVQYALRNFEHFVATLEDRNGIELEEKETALLRLSTMMR